MQLWRRFSRYGSAPLPSKLVAYCSYIFDAASISFPCTKSVDQKKLVIQWPLPSSVIFTLHLISIPPQRNSFLNSLQGWIFFILQNRLCFIQWQFLWHSLILSCPSTCPYTLLQGPLQLVSEYWFPCGNITPCVSVCVVVSSCCNCIWGFKGLRPFLTTFQLILLLIPAIVPLV